MVKDKTPQPPINPPEPEHRHEEHALSIDEELLDGPGRNEVERVDFRPFLVIHREYSCDREGCHATKTERILFAMEDVVEDFVDKHEESVATSAEVVDYNVLKVEHPKNGEEITVDARKKILTDKLHGACNGKPRRESPL